MEQPTAARKMTVRVSKGGWKSWDESRLKQNQPRTCDRSRGIAKQLTVLELMTFASTTASVLFRSSFPPLYIYICHINNSTDIPSWDTCRKPKAQSPDARNPLRNPANRVIMQLELCNVRLGTSNICLGVFSTSMKIVYPRV